MAYSLSCKLHEESQDIMEEQIRCKDVCTFYVYCIKWYLYCVLAYVYRIAGNIGEKNINFGDLGMN